MTADEYLDDAYRLEQRDKEIVALKALCARAADALEEPAMRFPRELIAELRKAAQ